MRQRISVISSYRGNLKIVHNLCHNLGNPEGSRKMCYIFTARKTQYVIVTDKQMEILAGCFLGDGYIEKRGSIQIEQSKAQREYFDWKFEQLKSLVSVQPREIKRVRQSGLITFSNRFVLRQFFRPLRMLLYPDGYKSVSSDLLNLVTPLSLAVWYMDDGCKNGNSQLVLCTDNLNDDSISKLQNYLEAKWNISTRIKMKREVNKSYKRLTIGSSSLVRFTDLIRPHIIPSMQYKISDPVTTHSIKRRNRF